MRLATIDLGSNTARLLFDLGGGGTSTSSPVTASR
jgi:hypothetical protein